MMQLLRKVMDPKQRDDISEVLSYMQEPDTDGTGKPVGAAYKVTPAYLCNWYPDGLRAVTVGPHSRQLVGVTRYYPMLTPKVVVDFEPAPPDKFWDTEKLYFFAERNIVYLPIRLGERMDEDGFRERLAASTRLMKHLRVESQQAGALKAAEMGVEDWLAQPELMALLDAYAVREVDGERTKKLSGNARSLVIKSRKQKLLQELREGLKSGRIVDPYERYRQPAPTSE